jgi:ABC-type nitrate/sulfonate/bicarbonate transport system substrate-binding protein
VPVSPGIPTRCNPNAIYVCAEPLIGFVHQGLKAKIVAGVNMCGSSLITKKPYNEPGDLEGLLIGVNYGSFQETVISKFIQDNQIKNVKLVDISNFPGRADAAFIAEPYATQAIPRKGHITTSETMLARPHACCGLAVSDDLIKNRKKTVKQIVEAQKKATDTIQKNSAEQNERIFNKYTKISWAGPALKSWKPSWWISDPNLLIKDTMDYAKFLGIPIDENDIFDTSFY